MPVTIKTPSCAEQIVKWLKTQPPPFHKRWFEDPKIKLYLRVRNGITVPEGRFNAIEIANIDTENDTACASRLANYLREIRHALFAAKFDLLYLESPGQAYFGMLLSESYHVDRFNTPNGGLTSNFYRFNISVEAIWCWHRLVVDPSLM